MKKYSVRSSVPQKKISKQGCYYEKQLQQSTKKYCNYILTRKPGKIGFEDTVQILAKIFSDKSSLFYACWKCWNLTKNVAEDFVTYADTVKREYEQIKIKKMTPDMFTTLIFVQGLIMEKEIPTKILATT